MLPKGEFERTKFAVAAKKIVGGFWVKTERSLICFISALVNTCGGSFWGFGFAAGR